MIDLLILAQGIPPQTVAVDYVSPPESHAVKIQQVSFQPGIMQPVTVISSPSSTQSLLLPLGFISDPAPLYGPFYGPGPGLSHYRIVEPIVAPRIEPIAQEPGFSVSSASTPVRENTVVGQVREFSPSANASQGNAPEGNHSVLEDPALEDPVPEDPVLEDPVLEDPVIEAPALETPTLNPRKLQKLQPESGSPTASEANDPNLGIDLAAVGVLELVADQQEYDRLRQWVSARGRVYLRFNGGSLWGDRLDINLQTQMLRATGNVHFQKGRQQLSGTELIYNLMQETGQILDAWGELDNVSIDEDLNFDHQDNQIVQTVETPPVGDRFSRESVLSHLPPREPLANIRLQGGMQIVSGFGLGLGDSANSSLNSNAQLPIELNTFRQEGTVQHWRFQADQVDLNPKGWVAERALLSNDPLNPPQFQLRTRRLRYRELEGEKYQSQVSEIRADRPRFVFDNVLPLPTFRNRVLLDRRPQDAGLFTLGFDNEDRGGLYIERGFEAISTDRLRVTLTPQLLLQNAFSAEGGNVLSPNAWGLKANFAAQLPPRTQFSGAFSIPQLNSDEFENDFRANVRGTRALPYGHILNLEYSYRDRLFNGSLGFQTVQQTLGAVIQSPRFQLGSTGIFGDYQLGAQWINADTDRLALLNPIRKNNRVDLGRYQFTAGLAKSISLWRGEALSDPRQALRYTPSAIVPGISLGLGVRGIYGLYSNGDSQEALIGSVGLYGNFGHFSRPWFDYTQVTLAYSQALRGNQSPFTFDRFEDSQVLTFGLTQQLYGPIRVGFSTTLNLVTGEEISTDYRLEYSRRAFKTELSYNPVLGVGALQFRINDFAWTGISEPIDPQRLAN